MNDLKMIDNLCKCGHVSSSHGRVGAILVGEMYPCRSCGSCDKYEQHFETFPSRCPDCNEPWSDLREVSYTCVGFYSPPGHNHDDNCMSRSIRCANDHRYNVSHRRSCPKCDWKGAPTCWCCKFAKVDKWPVIATSAAADPGIKPEAYRR